MRRAASVALLLFLAGCLALLVSDRVLIVRSASMSPAIQAGDAIVIWPTSGTPNVGDVVSYEVQGELVTHRVVEIRPDGVITKGDANREADLGRPDRHVRGRMVVRLPFLGWFLAFLRRPGGWLLLVILPAVGSSRSEVRRAASTLRDRARRGGDDRCRPGDLEVGLGLRPSLPS